MEFTKDSKILIHFLLKNDFKKFKLNKSGLDIYKIMFKIFKKNIESKQEINQEISNKKIFLLNESSRFLPSNIKFYIENTEAFQVKYKLKIKNKLIELNLITFNILDINYLDNLAENINLILNLFTEISESKCNDFLKIDIYLTEFKKLMPIEGRILGPDNVNSGYSYVCKKNGDIKIYRKEECLKVLIHECIHSFGLEFSHLDLERFKKEIGEIFKLDIDINIYEAYTEIWAELINISLIAFRKFRIEKKYIDFVEKLISLEIEYAIFQYKKVLCHNDISLKDIFRKRVIYKENSNVVSYYLVKCILFLDLNNFFDWCKNNNDNFIKFSDNPQNISKFLNFLKQTITKLEDKKFMDDKYKLDIEGKKNFKFILMNLRMSCLEI